MAKGHVGRRILQQDAVSESVLHGPHPGGNVIQGLFGVRQRQQVIQTTPGIARPTQVIRHEYRLDPPRQRAQAAQVGSVDRVHGSDRQPDAVQRHRTITAHPLEHPQRTAAGVDIVFGNRLEPVHPGTSLEDVPVMVRSQPDSKAERRPVIHRRSPIAAERAVIGPFPSTTHPSRSIRPR